jgi:hypothetical protein
MIFNFALDYAIKDEPRKSGGIGTKQDTSAAVIY